MGIARQAPLSMRFSRQEYWSWLPCPPPGDLPTQRCNPNLLCLLHWQTVFFTTSTTWEAPKAITEALFVIGPNWNQPKCLSTGSWINKLRYSHKWNITQQWKRWTHSNMDKSQNNYAEGSQSKKYIFFRLLIWDSVECKLIYSDRKQRKKCILK